MSESTSVTLAPSSTSRCASVEPINPSPPVIRTRAPSNVLAKLFIRFPFQHKIRAQGECLADNAPGLLVSGSPCLYCRPPRLDAPHVLAPHHQLPPQPGHVRQHPAQAPEVEELALAIRAMVVVHRHLGKLEVRVLQLLDQFEADRAVGRLE